MINIKEYKVYKKLRIIYYYFKSLGHRFIAVYETRLSTYIFYIFRPLIFFLEKFFEIKNYIFVINISDGIGHMVEELDYLYKFQNQQAFFKNKKIY